MRNLEKWLVAIFLFILVLAYGCWLFSPTYSLTIASLLSSAAVCLVFGILGIKTIGALVSGWQGQIEMKLDAGLGKRSLRYGHRHPVWRLVLTILFARLCVFIVAYIFLTLKTGYQGGLFDTLGIWVKGDAPHYLGIADNWYVTEGDPRFHIVFFPFYPICVRVLNVLISNTFASGLILSVAFTVCAGVLLYELALMDLDRAAAKRAVKFQMLLPAAFLFNAPMSDGLFLLLSIACVLFARKKHFYLACLIGCLAAFTRVLGIVLLVPVVVELCGEAVRTRLRKGKFAGFFWPRAAALLFIPAGLLLYLYVNYSVTGDAFTFLTYQSAHWNQRVGTFFHTAAYQTDYFLGKLTVDPSAAWGLWFPNLVFLIGAPLLMFLSLRPEKPALAFHPSPAAESSVLPEIRVTRYDPPRQPYVIRASYLAYFLVYYAVSMGATWLLSAPRYLTCCFPLAIALASRARPRGATMFVYALLAIAQLAYMWAYVQGWPVY